MDIELILFLLIVLLGLTGMIFSIFNEMNIGNKLLITSNILFIVYGGFMAITK